MMDLESFRDYLKFTIKNNIKVEIRHIPPGHMGTTYYSLVVEMDGEELLRIPICNDGFNDGDELGWIMNSTPEKE